MDQHVISRWLLAAFGRGDGGRIVLAGYDKTTGEYTEHDAAEFMVEVDGHSPEIERSIRDIETPAAAAARRLAKRVKVLPPGMYAVVGEGVAVEAAGDPFRDMGVRQGVRLLASAHTIPGPSSADRVALARYAGLMYQRAPKTEAAILRFDEEYDRAAQVALDRALPGMKTGLQTLLAQRRERMLGMAARIGDELVNANWFVIRPNAGESFVLGDSPVAATLSLGHDDKWRTIFAPESYAVVMPLGPAVALLMATQKLVPVSVRGEMIPAAINRLMWRSADRYVLGRTQSALESAVPGATDDDLRFTVEPAHDAEEIARAAEGDVQRIVMELAHKALTGAYDAWPRWDDHHIDVWPPRDGID